MAEDRQIEEYPFTLPEGVAVRRPDGPPYRSSKGFYMMSLFWDVMVGRPIAERLFLPVFTLHEDKEGYINCRKTFVEEGDPTGYKWAIKYLGSWPHWLKLVESRFFKEAYDVWLDELKAKQTSEAIAILEKISRSDDKGALQAARILANREWERGSGRGRPSKAEVSAELKKAVGIITAEEEDHNRIKLVASNGKTV